MNPEDNISKNSYFNQLVKRFTEETHSFTIAKYLAINQIKKEQKERKILLDNISILRIKTEQPETNLERQDFVNNIIYKINTSNNTNVRKDKLRKLLLAYCLVSNVQCDDCNFEESDFNKIKLKEIIDSRDRKNLSPEGSIVKYTTFCSGKSITNSLKSLKKDLEFIVLKKDK